MTKGLAKQLAGGAGGKGKGGKLTSSPAASAKKGGNRSTANGAKRSMKRSC